MYELFGGHKNRSFRVIWALEEMGLPYELIETPPGSEAARAISPLGKVPILRTEGRVISDSVAIMTYLADKHGQLTAPAGTLERAQQDSMVQFLNDEFDATLWCAARNSFILPEDKRVPEIKPTLKWEHARSQKEFLRRLDDQPFACGDAFTIADILATQCGLWARTAKFSLDPAYEAYVDRMTQRPAFRAALG